MRVLHLENDPHDIELLGRTLRGSGGHWQIQAVDNRRDFVQALASGAFDVIVADFNLPGFGGLEALSLSRQLSPLTPFVFFSGSIGEDQAIAALQAGAADYVLKDRMKRLAPAVRRVVADQRERRLRREAESSLVASQARYARLIDEAPDAIFSLSPAGAITSLNPAFEKITGWPRHRWIGRDFSALVHAGDRDRARELLGRARADLRPLTFELGIASASGAPLTVEFTVSFSGASPHAGEFLGIGRDITARQRAEALIREQAAVIDRAPVAITIVDLENRVRYWNRGATLLYGWTEAEALGQAIDRVLAPETHAAVREGCEATLRDGIWRGEVPLVARDGRRGSAELSLTLVRDERGAPTGCLGIALDVTEKQRLQEQFLRAQRMENLGLLAAGIAHDFNNILAPILMIAQLLRSDNPSAAHGRLLDTLEQSAQRGAALVKQILSFAQGSTEGCRDLQLKHLARDVVAMIEETFPKNIRLSHELPSDLWLIRGHPTQLHQVLLNLCVNARDAMPDGGELALTFANVTLDEAAAAAIPQGRPGTFVAVEIRDTGAGIPPHVLPHIWEPFFTTKASTHGTGLGLSTVRSILRNHDGFAEIASAPGEGTTFRLYFPAQPAVAEPPSGAMDAANTPRGNGELILVIEDEPGVRDLVHAVLQRHGYRPVTATDGLEAMNLLRLQPTLQPQLVLSDMAMPYLSGEALVPLLRRQLPQARILTMSGLGAADAKNGAADTGDAFLLKPFKPDALLAAIHRLLRGPA